MEVLYGHRFGDGLKEPVNNARESSQSQLYLSSTFSKTWTALGF